MLDITSLETLRKGALQRALKDNHIQVAINSKASLSSLLWMSDLVDRFTIQSRVNYSNAFGSLSRCRAVDAGLGNLRPNVHGAPYKQCPLFQELEIRLALNEFHVVVECSKVEFARRYKGITRYMETHVSLSRPIGIVFKDFLGGGMGPVLTQWRTEPLVFIASWITGSA